MTDFTNSDRNCTVNTTDRRDEYTCATCGAYIGNIVVLLDHDCERILSAPDLSSGERSTLLYIESCVVDQRGYLDPEKMNYEDEQNMKVLGAAGLVDIGQSEQDTAGDPRTLRRPVVKFTDAAWDLARDCRQMKSDDWIDHEADIGDVPEGSPHDGHPGWRARA